MSKKKRKLKSSKARSGGNVPRTHKSPQKRVPIVPMIVGGVGIIGLVLGGPWLLGKIWPVAPSVDGRKADVSTTNPAVGEGSSANQSPKGSDAATRDSAGTADRSKAKKASNAPSAATQKGQTVGLLAMLSTAATPEKFDGDTALAQEFGTATSKLLDGKSAVIVRRDLQRLMPKVKDNPGREHVLTALASTFLKSRAPDQALTQLDTLQRDFPETGYSSQIAAMRLNAELSQASGSKKGQAADIPRLRTLAVRAEALAEAESDPDVQAQALYVAASALERAGDVDKAIAGYQRLVTAHPDAEKAPVSLYRVAKAQAHEGHLEEAIQTARTLASTYPKKKIARRARNMVRELALIGKPAPVLQVEDWASGEATSLEALRGKVVLVNFWQTWCPHCREELPHLSEMYRTYRGQGLEIIGATKNDKRQDEEKLREFLEENPLPFPIARVNPRSSRDYAVTGIPAAALVDRQGIVVWRDHPGQLTPEMLKGFLAQ